MKAKWIGLLAVLLILSVGIALFAQGCGKSGEGVKISLKVQVLQ